jgi:glyceraldehyde 3-phosphate dehydrogenase
MTVHVAINGFGRIGRNILRPSSKTGARILRWSRSMTSGLSRPTRTFCRYDSVHGRFPGEVKVEGDAIMLRLRAEPHDILDARPVVPAAIEDRDSPAAGK